MPNATLLGQFHRVRKLKKQASHRVGPIPRAPRPRFPFVIESHYRTKLWAKVDELWTRAKPIFEKYIPLMIKQATALGIPQRDEWTDEFTAMSELLEATYGSTFEDEEIEDLAESMGGMISKFNGRELARVLAVIGGTTHEELWLDPHIESFTKENISLIKSIPRQNLDQVKSVIMRGIRGGYRYEEIMKDVKTRFGVSKSKAALIARDQVSKFNGNLSKIRQVHAGIVTYEWDTAHDERVRGRPGGLYPNAVPSHWIMQGVVCRWDDPTVYLKDGRWVQRTARMPIGHPGEPIACRCVALPRFEEDEQPEDQEDAMPTKPHGILRGTSIKRH